MYDNLVFYLVNQLHFQRLHNAVRALLSASARKVAQLIIITLFKVITIKHLSSTYQLLVKIAVATKCTWK